MTKWIKCSDRMPPIVGYSNCKSYLLWQGFPLFAYWCNEKWYECVDSGSANWIKPTHWSEIQGPKDDEL